MKKLLLLISGIVLYTCAYAQELQTPTAPSPRVISPLPNSASLGKYGDVPIGLYTGTLQYNMPLYTFQTKHLSVPISLNYSSNGVKVDAEDSKAGVDWALNSGGVITRTAYNGNFFGGGIAPAPPANGFYPNCTDPTALTSWANFYSQSATQLDEFNFNFGGYTGKFVLTSNGPVQIQYSNLKIEFNKLYPGNDWYFRITTPDGVMFYFGENGATESSNTFTSSVGPIQGDSYPPEQLTAFYLTRIVHPYDPLDVITFNYSLHSDNFISNITAFTRFPDPGCACSLNTNNFCASCVARPCPYGGHEIWDNGYEAYTITTNQGSALRLESIVSPQDGKVVFSYIEKSAQSQAAGNDCLLSQISVYSPSQQLLKSFGLDYHLSYGGFGFSSNSPLNSNNTSPEPRCFLIDVKENGSDNSQVRITKFAYNDVDNMAPRLSFAQDAYGYFNGQPNYRFIPDLDGFQTLHNLPVANRDPNFTFAVKGMLTQVTYPTGGYSQFTYEPHSSDVGGVRIKEVDTFDPASQVTSKKVYTYGVPSVNFVPNFRLREDHMDNLYFNGGNSNCYAAAPPMMCSYIILTSNSLIPLTGRGGYLVYYSNVTETDGLNSENGGIEHYFNNDPINPFISLQGGPIYGITAPSYSWKWAEETNTNYFKIVGGNKVYVKKIVNNWVTDPRKNALFTQYAIKKEDYQGTPTPLAPDNPANDALYLLSAYDIISYTTQQQWNYIKSTVTTDYDLSGSNPATKTVNYYYDNADHALLTRTEIQGSDGKLFQEVNKYVGDQASVSNLNASETDAITKLQSQYRISTLLEKDVNNNGVLASRIHNGYKDWGNSLILPETFKIQNANHALETRMAYQSYELTNGDLKQYANNNESPVSYFWGYNKHYPIAELKNASLNQAAYTSFEEVVDEDLPNNPNNWDVESPIVTTDAKTGRYSCQIGLDPIYSTNLIPVGTYTITCWVKGGLPIIDGGTILSSSSAPADAKGWIYVTTTIQMSSSAYISISANNSSMLIDELRLYPSNAQISTYTYDPKIGITSMMDTKGVITYYEYDNFQRLINTRDKDGNIINHVDYHYAQ